MSDPNHISSSNPAIPTGAQLAGTRLKQWHQQGEALLTAENLRSWLNAAGLVLFAPRPQILSPAPSLVEAVLGEPNATPSLEQIAAGRDLMARLVAEGLAVPLNLMGATGPGVQGAVGETPDFVASTAVFSYIFTLRGDKAWKQPPATAGALKVSPLALATYEALTGSGPLTALDLAAKLGKEVTEAAVLRALGELWTHLRVLPMPMPDGRPTVWELAGTRFTKQIKAGANAGQPAALSALISLYLGQAVVASEDEIEGFLSPLAARSRIRDVIHALLGARQLDTMAVDGRTVLHVAGELPAFFGPAAEAVEAPASVEGGPSIEGKAATHEADADVDGEARIAKYVPRPRKIGTGYLAKASPSKFGAKPFGARKFGDSTPGVTGFASRPGFKAAARSGFKAGPKPERERRPFGKTAGGFDKPWDEEKARRLAAAAKPSDVGPEEQPAEFAASAAASEARAQPISPRIYKPREDRGEQRGAERRPSFGKRPASGGKPAFREKPAFDGKPRFGSRPSFGDSRPPRRDFAAPGEGVSSDARPPRKTFSKPGTFGRKREGFGGKPSFENGRPPRRDFAPRPQNDRPGGARTGVGRPGGSQGGRSDGRESGNFAPRKPYPPRGAGFFSAKPRPSDDRLERSAGSPVGRGDGQARQDRGSTSESGKRVYRKFDAPRDRPARPSSSNRTARPDGFAGKPSGGFGPRRSSGGSAGARSAAEGRSSGKPGGGLSGKKPFGNSGGFARKSGGVFKSKPTGTFAKFADNKKPFGKRPPARKFKAKDNGVA